MNNVLIIAPYFLPSSYPPALRHRLLCLHLRAFGWNPIVLTVKPEYLGHSFEYEMMEMIPKSIEIIRTNALSEKITGIVGVRDIGIRSLYHLWKKADEICAKRIIDLVFVSGPPWMTSLICPFLKRKYNIPFVLDYMDPWVAPEYIKYRLFSKRFLVEKIAQYFEPQILKHSSGVTSVSDGISKHIKERNIRQAHKIFGQIPFGVEVSDFASPLDGREDQCVAGEKYFHVSYVGVVWPEAYGVIISIMKALQNLKKENKKMFNRMRWDFVGTSYNPKAAPQVLPFARKYDVESIVTERVERVSYLSALKILQKTDAILAIGSCDPAYTPSKIYNCIVAAKPILAIYHGDSPAVDLLRKVDAVSLITFSERERAEVRIPQIIQGIKNIVNRDKRQTNLNLDHLGGITATDMTQKMCAVFDYAVSNFNRHTNRTGPGLGET